MLRTRDLRRQEVAGQPQLRDLIAELATLHTEKIRELKTRGAQSSDES